MVGYKSVWGLFISLFLYLGVVAQPVTFEYLTSKNGLPQNKIRGIVKDKYGFMWFGTWNGLCRYDGYQFKIYNHKPEDSTSLTSSRVHYLFKDKYGVLWVSVFNQGVCRYNYNTDNFTRFNLASLPQALRDSVNRLRSLDVFEKNKTFLNEIIGPFHWSLTGEHIVFDVPLSEYGGLNDVNVNAVYRDNAGILWVGTGSGGVNKADLSASKFYHVPLYANGPADPPSAVRSICVDQQGAWLGTEDKGLFYWDAATGQSHDAIPALKGQNIKALLKDQQGYIWIGKRSGLDRYDPVTRKLTTFFNDKKQSEYSRFYAMAEDPLTHHIWFCYYNGLLRYDPQTGAFEKQPTGCYERSGAGSIFFDQHHNLWIGTEYSGLIHLERKSADNNWISTIKYPAGSSKAPSWCERIYAITEDKEGRVWLGGANGLAQLHPETGAVKTYTAQNGIANQYVTGMSIQGNGDLWLAHKSGLSKINTQTGQVQNYAVQKPGQNYEFMDGAGFLDRSSGRLYFGSTEGFIYFQPAEIINNPYLPKPTFTLLQILNKTVNTGDTVNGRVVLSMPLHMTPAITLTYEDKSFSLEFSALHYSNPARNQYAYMLEGEDKEWIYTCAERRVASYANLAPGNYIMKVKASNSDGVWNTAPATIRIMVLPPWWKTTWAYGLYLLLIGLAFYLVYRIVKTRQAYHRKIVTERLKAEKAGELERMKTRFFTNISHEFRTPLTLIVDPLRILLTKQDATEKERSYYGVMYNNSQRLLTLLNQFLDFRKLESGKINLKPQSGDVVAFIRNTAAAFELKASQQQIDFKVTADPGTSVIGFDADVLGKILYNLLSNAFKFTPAGGQIVVDVKAASEVPDEVAITVTDTGKGIPAENLDQVFEPFFQVERTEQHAGTGVGLSLTKELAELHKGCISVTSEPGVLTVFKVVLASLKAGDQDVIATALAQESTEVNWVANAASDDPGVSEKPVILIVEDNEDVRQYMAQHLSESYTVLESVNGGEGVAKAIESVPDLIVSDVMMPILTGVDLCRQLKAEEKTSHIPIVLLTARQSEQNELEGYETGADAYVVKPFNMNVLLARVKNLIANRARLRERFSQSPDSYQNPFGLSEPDKAFLNKATELVTAHMSDAEVNVEWLAGQLFMSRTQLYRKVKAITDLSVHEFVTGIRLSKAAALLREGTYTVTEIAFMVGYSDASSFSRMFQRQYDMTPKKYSQVRR